MGADYEWRCSNLGCYYYEHPEDTGDQEQPDWVLLSDEERRIRALRITYEDIREAYLMLMFWISQEGVTAIDLGTWYYEGDHDIDKRRMAIMRLVRDGEIEKWPKLLEL